MLLPLNYVQGSGLLWEAGLWPCSLLREGRGLDSPGVRREWAAQSHAVLRGCAGVRGRSCCSNVSLCPHSHTVLPGTAHPRVHHPGFLPAGPPTHGWRRVSQGSKNQNKSFPGCLVQLLYPTWLNNTSLPSLGRTFPPNIPQSQGKLYSSVTHKRHSLRGKNPSLTSAEPSANTH